MNKFWLKLNQQISNISVTKMTTTIFFTPWLRLIESYIPMNGLKNHILSKNSMLDLHKAYLLVLHIHIGITNKLGGMFSTDKITKWNTPGCYTSKTNSPDKTSRIGLTNGGHISDQPNQLSLPHSYQDGNYSKNNSTHPSMTYVFHAYSIILPYAEYHE